MLVVFCSNSIGAESQVIESSTIKHEQTGVTIVAGTVPLSGKGIWVLDNKSAKNLTDLTLVPPALILDRSRGERGLLREEKKRKNKARYVLIRVYREIKQYASDHEGKSPASFSDIEDSRLAKDQKHFKLVSPVRILDEDGDGWADTAEPPTPVLYEIDPLVDDGKHWVGMSNGTVKRLSINEKWAAFVTPLQQSITEQLAALEKSAPYQLIARLAPEAVGTKILIPIHNKETQDSLVVTWDLSQSQKNGDIVLLKQWASSRQRQWGRIQGATTGGLLPFWMAAVQRQYDIETVHSNRNARNARRAQRAQDSSLFNVLGGGAAIRETLQLQTLTGKANAQKLTIPMDSIKGVEVKSHPFEEMLGQSEGGRLMLAELAPADRFMAWFASPEKLFQYLHGGSDFIFHGSASVTGVSNAYNLQANYFNQLGIDETWGRKFLESGAVSELMILLPDLFLLDGTDMTLVMRLQHPAIARPLLRLMGVTGKQQIQRRQASDGGSSYWSLSEDLLIISTRKQEIQQVLDLHATSGDGSLGRSAEFRYMLSQQPISETTDSYFYFSDPFIRRLVGPEVKIAQMRRLLARAEMQSVVAGLMLYRLDGHSDQPTLEELVAGDYMSAPVLVKDLSIQPDGSVRSATWQAPAHLPTVLEMSIQQASKYEQQAYNNYLTRYNRFWRQFFDPIGVRVSSTAASEMEISTFILPLIDNSIYQVLRDVLVTNQSKDKLPVLALQPQPVAMLSMNMRPKIWAAGEGMLQKFLIKFIGISPRVMDYFGSDLHIALGDSDPIIIMGSGGISGSLGMLQTGGGSTSMLMLPVVGALLTRPLALFIGLTEPDVVKEILQGMATGGIRNSIMSLGRGGLYRVAGKDEWRYELTLEGIISMRFGIALRGRYLVITNLPFSYDPTLLATDIAPNNGAALSLSPAAAVQQRPALYASAMGQQRQAAMEGVAMLYPFMASGANSVAEAQQKIEQIFGYTSIHPGQGNWRWDDGVLSSTAFGTHSKQSVPEHQQEGQLFGVLQNIESVQLNMQFEDDGLRARASWKLLDISP